MVQPYALDDFFQRLSTGFLSSRSSSSLFSSGWDRQNPTRNGWLSSVHFTLLCFLCRFFQRSDKLIFVATPGAFKDLLCSTIVFQNISKLDLVFYLTRFFFTFSKGLKISGSGISVSTLVLLAVQLEPNLEISINLRGIQWTKPVTMSHI